MTCYCRLIALVIMCLIAHFPEMAEAKPQPGKSGSSRSALTSARRQSSSRQKRVRRSVRRRLPSRHGLILSFIADAPLHDDLASFGLAAEYQLRLISSLSFTAGTEMRFHQRFMYLQPQIGLDVEARRLSTVALHAGGGLALPLRIAHDHTAAALALRGFGGLRWHWSMANRIKPQIQIHFLLGPMLTHHSEYAVYAALQVTLGMRFAL